MAPLTVGLSDYWTIGLLFYLMFSINTFTHLLEYKRPCTVGLLDYWTIAPFNLLNLYLYMFSMNYFQNFGKKHKQCVITTEPKMIQGGTLEMY